ncbi:hypothetical protein BC832DRAFT_540183 [Gaertneriomyces semiglobifer]|nr:hypothetical protein BC832DRAFT_540183 [Gaertneriomyces semiglobifer]
MGARIKDNLLVDVLGHNAPGETGRRFCAQHWAAGMVDPVKICEHDGCGKHPNFHFPGKLRPGFAQRNDDPGMSKRSFCSDHKEPGMVDLIPVNVCQAEGCMVLASFNLPGEIKPVYCKVHKEPAMVEVIKKRCERSGCDVTATYGYPGQPVRFCWSHREPKTIAKPRKRCEESRCSELPIDGMTEREHCAQHKSPDAVNILGHPCVSCGLLGILDSNGHCETCDPDMFKRMRLAKQNVVKDFLKANNVDAVVDRIIDAGDCGRERPDFWIDCGTHILVMEVDEHQHSGRACECEQTKMVNIIPPTARPAYIAVPAPVAPPARAVRKTGVRG